MNIDQKVETRSLSLTAMGGDAFTEDTDIDTLGLSLLYHF